MAEQEQTGSRHAPSGTFRLLPREHTPSPGPASAAEGFAGTHGRWPRSYCPARTLNVSPARCSRESWGRPGNGDGAVLLMFPLGMSPRRKQSLSRCTVERAQVSSWRALQLSKPMGAVVRPSSPASWPPGAPSCEGRRVPQKTDKDGVLVRTMRCPQAARRMEGSSWDAGSQGLRVFAWCRGRPRRKKGEPLCTGETRRGFLKWSPFY